VVVFIIVNITISTIEYFHYKSALLQMHLKVQFATNCLHGKVVSMVVRPPVSCIDQSKKVFLIMGNKSIYLMVHRKDFID